MGCFNQRNRAPVAESGRSNILPVLAAVSGEVNQTAIASSPDQVAMERRRRDRRYDSVASLLGVLDSCRFRQLLGPRTCGGAREIGADGFPVQTSVDRLHHVLRTEIESLRISRAKHQDRRPRCTIPPLVDFRIEDRDRPGSDVLAQSCPTIEASDPTITRAEINEIRIVGIERHISALARTGWEPVSRRDLSVIGAAQNRGTTAILLCPVHNIGKLVIGDDMVKLCRGLVVPSAPGLAAIETDRSSLVGSEKHAG